MEASCRKVRGDASHWQSAQPAGDERKALAGRHISQEDRLENEFRGEVLCSLCSETRSKARDIPIGEGDKCHGAERGSGEERHRSSSWQDVEEVGWPQLEGEREGEFDLDQYKEGNERSEAVRGDAWPSKAGSSSLIQHVGGVLSATAQVLPYCAPSPSFFRRGENFGEGLASKLKESLGGIEYASLVRCSVTGSLFLL